MVLTREKYMMQQVQGIVALEEELEYLAEEITYNEMFSNAKGVVNSWNGIFPQGDVELDNVDAFQEKVKEEVLDR